MIWFKLNTVRLILNVRPVNQLAGAFEHWDRPKLGLKFSSVNSFSSFYPSLSRGGFHAKQFTENID